MSSKDKLKQKQNLKLYILMAVMFGLGYYFLDHVSTWEDPILGNTFYIVIGCVLMAIPFVIAIKLISDNIQSRKRAKSKSSHRGPRIFLDDPKAPNH